ncbi:MAG: LemA family protein, partial [Planctomycetes bacterium]|nr:LemA family protein [Planctomycetota bacterium]
MTAQLSSSPAVLVAILLAAGLLLWTALAFNRLVRGRNLVREAWSGIDVQLKRRRNLIPPLVETVRAYGRHERTVLEELARIRGRHGERQDVRGQAEAENALTDRLRGLLALAEANPSLKADRNYRLLMEQLAEIEDQIQYARRYYNGAVRDYNIRVESFPSNLVARLTGFPLAEFFQVATATERAVP